MFFFLVRFILLKGGDFGIHPCCPPIFVIAWYSIGIPWAACPLPVDGHVGCFQFGAVTDRAAVDK